MDQFPARFRPCAIQHAGEQQPRQVHKRGDVQLDHGHVGRQVTFRGESAFTNFVRRMTPMRATRHFQNQPDKGARSSRGQERSEPSLHTLIQADGPESGR